MRNTIPLLLFVATILNKLALTQRYELCASDITSESVCRPAPPEMDVAAAFIEACIVNEILPKAPEGFLGIGFTTALANLGNRIDPVRTVLPPNLYYFDEAIPTANYTLIIIDGDTPSRAAPALRSYLLNLCVNIPGNQLDQRNGFSAAPWIGPSPSPGSGEHRVVGLLYQQETYINTNDRNLINVGVTRLPFDLAKFVENYCLGTPVAGNFWLASVPVDYEACCTGGACAENQLCTTNQLCTRNQLCTANQLCASASTNACTRCG